MINKELLNRIQYLFDDFIIANIAKFGIIKSFKANDIIINIGQDLTHIPLLLKRNIKVLSIDHNQSELLLYVLESGDTYSMSLKCCMSKS